MVVEEAPTEAEEVPTAEGAHTVVMEVEASSLAQVGVQEEDASAAMTPWALD